jgi:hypothetical protein
MVCELIALASVMAHGDFGVILSAKIKDEDRPGALLKMLEQIHPDCYPRPIKQILNSAGEVVSIDDIRTGFLTRAELPRLYGLCGNELHKGKLHKIGRFPKPEKSQREILNWYEKILWLLGNHKIKLHNSTSEIWVGMEEKNTHKVFWNFMITVSPDALPPDAIQLARSELSALVRRSKSSKRRSSARKGAKRGQRGTRGRS